MRRREERIHVQENIEKVLSATMKIQQADMREMGEFLFTLDEYTLPEKVTFKLRPQNKKGAGYVLARQEKSAIYVAFRDRCVNNLKKACLYTCLQGCLAPYLDFPL